MGSYQLRCRVTAYEPFAIVEPKVESVFVKIEEKKIRNYLFKINNFWSLFCILVLRVFLSGIAQTA